MRINKRVVLAGVAGLVIGSAGGFAVASVGDTAMPNASMAMGVTPKADRTVGAPKSTAPAVKPSPLPAPKPSTGVTTPEKAVNPVASISGGNTAVPAVQTPGEVRTITVPGATRTVTVPGATQTRTVTVPGPVRYITKTVNVPGPTKTVTKVVTQEVPVGMTQAQIEDAYKKCMDHAFLLGGKKSFDTQTAVSMCQFVYPSAGQVAPASKG